MAAPGTILKQNMSKKWRVFVMFSNYRMQKYLVLIGLYTTVGIFVSASVGDVALGFGLATLGCLVLYAVAVEFTK